MLVGFCRLGLLLHTFQSQAKMTCFVVPVRQKAAPLGPEWCDKDILVE
jgi:hypothetical protein